MLYSLLALLVIMLASLAGVLFTWRGFGATVSRNLHYLVSLSAGVFLVVSIHLVEELSVQAASFATAAGWVALGVGGFWLVFNVLLPHVHGKEEAAATAGARHLDARRVILSDAIHNVGDGLLVATAFGLSPSLGVLTAVSVFFHELPQEAAEFFILKRSGYSTRTALLLNFSVSSTILIGAVLGSFLLGQSAVFAVPVLGIAAGAFLVVVAGDLIPHALESAHTTRQYLRHAACFATGVVLMFTVNLATGHNHSGEHEHNHKESGQRVYMQHEDNHHN